MHPGDRYKNLVKDTKIAKLIELPVKIDGILEERFEVILEDKKLQTAKYQLIDIIEKAELCKERQSYFEYMRKLFICIIRQNISKARSISGESYYIKEEEIIWVLSTSVFFVPDYNFSLLENRL